MAAEPASPAFAEDCRALWGGLRSHSHAPCGILRVVKGDHGGVQKVAGVPGQRRGATGSDVQHTRYVAARLAALPAGPFAVGPICAHFAFADGYIPAAVQEALLSEFGGVHAAERAWVRCWVRCMSCWSHRAAAACNLRGFRSSPI